MTDLDTIIASGLIEAYCLGTLPDPELAEVERLAAAHPQIRQEIEATHRALEQIALQSTRKPSPATRARILDTIESLRQEEQLDITRPPMINRHSNPQHWLKAMQDLKPDIFEPGLGMTLIREDAQATMAIMWLGTELLEEPHPADEFEESFLILSGHCICDFDGHVFQLGPGGHIKVPPGKRHKITNINPQDELVAVVQRRKAA